ncbi:MAG: GNAT family N-acetyltransferase [Actinobacteria bacterium]|nr:GNAT family N-acetyltransferase [Actinomycetota bacterium]
MRVRAAEAGDAAAVAVAVEALLEELGGRRPQRPQLEAEVAALIAGDAAGELLVAEEEEGGIVGVLAASWQRAIHVPGRYATIQDLWVDRRWRGRGIGAALVGALADRARAQGAARIEVGLPREDFAALERTEAFYRGAGFEHLGPRMRLLFAPNDDRGCPLSGIAGQRTTTSAGGTASPAEVAR